MFTGIAVASMHSMTERATLPRSPSIPRMKPEFTNIPCS